MRVGYVVPRDPGERPPGRGNAIPVEGFRFPTGRLRVEAQQEVVQEVRMQFTTKRRPAAYIPQFNAGDRMLVDVDVWRRSLDRWWRSECFRGARLVAMRNTMMNRRSRTGVPVQCKGDGLSVALLEDVVQ
jgi:hypothetical protein